MLLFLCLYACVHNINYGPTTNSLFSRTVRSTPEFHNLIRILTKRAILWTEMVVDETIVYTDNLDAHLLISSPHLQPIICQIGGRSSENCNKAVLAVRRYGYKEVNLNVDCPSSRVSGKRQFGAILMAQEHQETCYDVISTMKKSSEILLQGDTSMEYGNHDNDKEHVNKKSKTESRSVPPIPISVKTRVGIETGDGQCFDDLDYLSNFIQNLRQRGCKRFVIHARKCVIGGLTPAENRLVPPLNYPRFYSLCRRFLDCEFVLNGGIPGLQAARHLCYGGADENTDNTRSTTKNIDTFEDRNEQTLHSVKHSVPCSICNVKNGSCTAPPKTPNHVPNNLVGCMIGRACMENPAMFWDVDRYFYGMKENPCQTRREVLEQYCKYLEETYPRRCCDLDERVTFRIPVPLIQLSPGGCHNCYEFYGMGKYSNNACTVSNKEGEVLKAKAKVKISSKVIDRSLKPILGIFFGQPKSKFFRRECDRLSRDKSIRNCGPGYIVRKVMSVLPPYMLDEEFVKSEDLCNVPKHVSPI